jgi:hypothetical protein
VRDVLEERVAKLCEKGPLDYDLDGRIQRVGGRDSGGGD